MRNFDAVTIARLKMRIYQLVSEEEIAAAERAPVRLEVVYLNDPADPPNGSGHSAPNVPNADPNDADSI